jgi:hypothetical protein
MGIREDLELTLVRYYRSASNSHIIFRILHHTPSTRTLRSLWHPSPMSVPPYSITWPRSTQVLEQRKIGRKSKGLRELWRTCRCVARPLKLSRTDTWPVHQRTQQVSFRIFAMSSYRYWSENSRPSTELRRARQRVRI